MERTYWNEEIETMAPEALRRLEAGLLRDQVDYARRASPFYARKLDDAGVQPERISCQESLEAVPFTEKAELAEAQRDGALIGPNLCAPFEDVVRIVATGGTSGQPLRLAWTRNDIAAYNEMGARALWAMGCRPGDLVVNCFNYSLYAGGIMDHMAFETLGAAVLPYGVGQSRRLLEMMAGLADGLCLYATPSYAVRLAEVAAEQGIDPRGLGVGKGFFSGEAGLQVPGYRARIEALWGIIARDLYGIAELGGQSGECAQRSGLHYCGGGLVIAELIDPETGAVCPTGEGAVGELVYTSLTREACPILRLRSHDLVEMLSAPCPCGRTGPRFRVLGRSDDMFVVKGVNVFPLAVQEVLAGLGPRVTAEFQIVFDRPPPIDTAPLLRVEAARALPETGRAALCREIEDRLRRHLGFAARVELVPQGRIAAEHKTRRLCRAYAGETPA